MSKWRDKAREIREAGIAERGNFEPTGAPKRAYDYWLRNAYGVKAKELRRGERRENFCHFWRVVLFWAPLSWVMNKVLLTDAFAAVAAIAVFVGAALIIGLSTSWTSLVIFIGVVLVGGAALGGIVAGIRHLIIHHWNSDWNGTVAKVLFGLWLAAIGCYGILALVIGFVNVGWIFLLFVAGGVLVMGGLILGISALSDFISGRRVIKRQQDTQRVREYLAEHGELPPVAEKQPGFFSGLADFFLLIVSAIRVKKWKICPLVDIETEN